MPTPSLSHHLMVPLHKSSADCKLYLDASIALDGLWSCLEGIGSRLTSGSCAMSSGSITPGTTPHQAGMFVSIIEERSSDLSSGLQNSSP